LQVAQLAGIPRSVVAAAKRKLFQLERIQVAQNTSQPDMFITHELVAEIPIHPVLRELETMQADDLTPKQALDFLYKLKDLINKD
jgi:DNA mismatch repair protein MutS